MLINLLIGLFFIFGIYAIWNNIPKNIFHNSNLMGPNPFPHVEITGSSARWKDEIAPPIPAIDYMSYVTFKTKGAFVAGNKIKIKINFKTMNNEMFESIKGKLVHYIFWKTNLSTENPMDHPNNWSAKEITNKETTFKGKVRYSQPGKYHYTIIVLSQTDPEYSLELQKSREDAITIESHQTKPQIINNLIMVILILIGIVIAYLQLTNG